MERYGALIRPLSPGAKRRLKQHRAGSVWHTARTQGEQTDSQLERMLALHPSVSHSLAGCAVYGCCVPNISLSSHRPSTPHGSDHILDLPHWDSTHPTLMLYADKRFNNRIEDGRVWFQPVPDRPDDYLVCCAEDEDNDFLLQHCTRVDANGAPADGATLHQLRRPAAWNPAQALWPPPLVFDLHREVWVRYQRWVGKSKEPQDNKEDSYGDAVQPAEDSNKKQRTSNSV